MRTLNLLILDDHLPAMRTALKKALCYYANFDSESESGVEIGSMHKNPTAHAIVKSSRRMPPLKLNLTSNVRLREVYTVVDTIDAGKWDRPWDGIIIDDNWDTEGNGEAGTKTLLPLLRERSEIERYLPSYMILTQHIDDRERAKNWSDAISSKISDARRFEVLGKEDAMRISQWLHRLTLPKAAITANAAIQAIPVRDVLVSRDHLAIRLENGRSISVTSGRNWSWILWIFRLRANGVAFPGYFEYLDLREKMLNAKEESHSFPSVTAALAKLKNLNPACAPPSDDKDFDAQDFSKALSDFFKKTTAQGVDWPTDSGASRKSLKIFEDFLEGKTRLV